MAAVIVAPASVSASCFADRTGGDAPYASLLASQPGEAIKRIRAALAAGSSAGANGPSTAHLYAMLMDAYAAQGEFAKAREYGALGVAALTAADGSGLRHRLQLNGIRLLDDLGQLFEAQKQYDVASRDLPADAPEYVCMLINRGYLRQRAGLKTEATTDLMRAYQLAKGIGNDDIRLDAGSMLAGVYIRYGLFDEARELADEAVNHYNRTHDKVKLGWAYFTRGDVYLHADQYAEAKPDLVQSLQLLDAYGRPTDSQYPQQRLCQAAAYLPDVAAAQSACLDAYRRSRALGDRENVKLIVGSQGQVALHGGHAVAAIALLDRALADDGVELSNRKRAQFHLLRGQARSQVGDVAGALNDTNVYLKWLQTDHAATDADRVAVLRVRFEGELKDQELRTARAEIAATRAIAAREGLVRKALLLLAVAALIAVALTAYIWRRRQEFMRAREATRERLAALARLTGGIAHEFNNQLTVMQQALGILARRPSVAADTGAQELVRDALQSSQTSAAITGQMQSFARQQYLLPKAVLIGSVLKEMMPKLQVLAGPGVRMSLQLPEEVPCAWVDQRQLSAALLNLVANARDAVHDGGSIVLRAFRAGKQRVSIEVADDGIGMTREQLAHAIEPFFTTKPVGEGMGLGLSMVEGFAKQSGGSMEIRSEPGHGTVVTLSLPIAEGQHEP